MSTEEATKYRALVVDSGPIIRLTGLSGLWQKAEKFYTVPAVLQEIRDAKAREHLDNLPFELIPKAPTPEAIKAVTDFAKQTGDYQSLSSVDIQVLGLLYDLEKEGCGDMSHIRTEPKRMLGVGKIEALAQENRDDRDSDVESEEDETDGEDEEGTEDQKDAEIDTKESPSQEAPPASAPKSWANLVNPSASKSEPSIAENNVAVAFGKMNLGGGGGQFSDADEDTLDGSQDSEDIEVELQQDFPSLSAAATVPYEDEEDEKRQKELHIQALLRQKEEDEKRKAESLKPISKSGKLYNSFTKYKDLMKPAPKVVKKPPPSSIPEQKPSTVQETTTEPKSVQSKIIGGATFAGQDDVIDDDGEGWITNTKEIDTMKANGILSPGSGPASANLVRKVDDGPTMAVRAACATTDFAMQNVILQMNLELLSVDGMKVKKLKSWVTRCGACFKVYTNTEAGPLGKRLFCEHCGSDMMQRVAASLDGKTGRLRLHLKKNYQHNLRGTKFSLPKPGKGDRFQGDLLLREDQMMMGAWNQKVKVRTGGKAKASAESMFGHGIASDVGCNTRAVDVDDIRVGFGRRNPNAAKGRERRGKKKKASNKACGLRRY